jgi:hypothetical protein
VHGAGGGLFRHRATDLQEHARRRGFCVSV